MKYSVSPFWTVWNLVGSRGRGIGGVDCLEASIVGLVSPDFTTGISGGAEVAEAVVAGVGGRASLTGAGSFDAQPANSATMNATETAMLR